MTKSDLKQYEGMYYIGDIVDIDGDGWVDEETFRTNIIRT